MGLGIVTKCTLTANSTHTVKYFNVDGRSYCVVDHGIMRHSQAFDLCKSLNARLPLPRNRQEADEFIKIGGKVWTHADARNPFKLTDLIYWVDAEDKQLGYRPVYLWGHKFKFILYFNY